MLLNKSFTNAAAIGVAVMCVGSPASAQTTCEEAELFDVAGGAFDLFGTAVDIDGGTAVVGAMYDDDNGSNAGSAYVFRDQGSGWVQVQQLLATDEITEGERFGRSVAIDNGTVVVGAIDYVNGDHLASAFVFRLDAAASQWSQEQKLLIPVGSGPVAISGDRILVGASNDDQNGLASPVPPHKSLVG